MSTWASIIATNWDPDEWEIVNDDGFVYKRKKRRIDPTSFARAPDPEPDPALRIKEKRKNKRAALLKLKEKYLKEISGWDNLSNTLKAKQDSVISKREQVKKSSGEDKEGGKLLEMGDKGFESVDNSSGSLLDELLKQVEEQETILHNIEQLCDVAESLCYAHEEMAKTSYLNLPVWEGNPRETAASLCED
ncbi:hypothetical protein SOVF_026050 [Spinacia oleracea]|uniref:t-SNARE coiled-coil homology domain-containing protein n=1 Tax=Spinacia oleracea TaxID=3562 RepID=A0A9R0J1A8_SPIOL|nr:uncharacterized protein LOC110798633 [Spinacia oleracea]KNA23308.1 hypothetical protein SOVF_026050 [Spinacia oleracea]